MVFRICVLSGEVCCFGAMFRPLGSVCLGRSFPKVGIIFDGSPSATLFPGMGRKGRAKEPKEQVKDGVQSPSTERDPSQVSFVCEC